MINSIVIVGRLTADPDLRTTPSGMQVASFRIANDDGSRGPNGEKNTVYINCTLFGKQAQTLQRFFRKGSLIGVTGRLSQRTYVNKQNVNVTVTEIIANRIDFVDSKGNSDAASNNNGYTPDYMPQNEPAPQAQPAPSGDNLDELDFPEDDFSFN